MPILVKIQQIVNWYDKNIYLLECKQRMKTIPNRDTTASL